MPGRMDIKLIAHVACSILAVLATHGSCQGPASDCRFRFHQQPGTDLNCNPYQDTTTLHLTCFAGGPLNSWLQIVWWFSKLSSSGSSTQPLAPQRIGGPDYQVTETRANNSLSTLVSSTLSLRVGEGGAKSGSCVWCEIEAPGRILVATASTQLCVREQKTYRHLRDCELQEVVPHSFDRVCVRELSVATTRQPSVSEREPLRTRGVLNNGASDRDDPVIKTSMQTGATLIRNLDPEPTILTSTPSAALPGDRIHTVTDTPSTSVDIAAGGSISSSSLAMQQGPATTTSGLPPGLLPTPTGSWGAGRAGEERSGSLLSSDSLTALYAAAVVCVLLAAVVVVLVTVVLVMCRRHNWLKRRSSAAGKESGSPSRLGPHLPRATHYRSQLSFSGSETVMTGEMKRDLGGGGVPFAGPRDTRRGSEPEALKGSLDTRSSIGSRSISTEKSNSLPRKNSLQHKYAEIDTISHSESLHSKMSHSTRHQTPDTGCPLHGGNGSIPSSKVIPPPPNTRARSSSTPHFYYILERMDDGGEERGEEEEEEARRLKCPWEVGAPAQIKSSRSREGSAKSRAGSLKSEVGGATATAPGGGRSEFCWGDGTMRSRSGSCPGRERKGGSTKRTVVSREGSSKSTKSRLGSGKKRAGSSEGNGGGRVVVGSREGSVKSRGSRDGSCKKQLWVPAPDLLQGNRAGETRVPPPPYDALEPRVGSYPSPFSIINESYLAGNEDETREALFDDPKYAAVSVGDLPQLVDQQQRHLSLDPIIPRRDQRNLAGPSGNRAPLHGRVGGTVGRVKAASSKSLQDSGVLGGGGGEGGGGGGGGGGGVRESIYQTRDSTPVHGIGMSVGGNIPSRLSMPFDTYYS